jgi:hypothetical protein
MREPGSPTRVLNLVNRVLEVHRNPEPSTDARHGWRYATIERDRASDRVAPLALPSRSISVADLLP